MRCDYPDGVTQDLEPEASNNTVLERVNYAITLLEELKTNSPNTNRQTETIVSVLPLQTPSRTAEPLGHIVEGPDISKTRSAFTGDGFGQLDIPEAAARTSGCESLLRWPVLNGICQDQSAISFALEATFGANSHTRQQGLIQQDYIWPLCRKFLALIHLKNPILDVSEFSKYARNVTEYGPGWDGAGCLVVGR